LYNQVSINVNGLVYLNGSAVFIGVNPNTFCTNSSGVVYYRAVNNASDLATISAKVLSVYSNYTFFVAQQAFVVTW
jgi:hypothetical protein